MGPKASRGDLLGILLVELLLWSWLGYLWLVLGLRGHLEGWHGLLLTLAALVASISLLLVAYKRARPAIWILTLASMLSFAVMALENHQQTALNRRSSQALAQDNQRDNRQTLNDALLQAGCNGGFTLTLNQYYFDSGNSVMRVIAIPGDHSLAGETLITVGDGVRPPGLRPEHRRKLDAYTRQGSPTCRQTIAAMLQQLETFSVSKRKP